MYLNSNVSFQLIIPRLDRKRNVSPVFFPNLEIAEMSKVLGIIGFIVFAVGSLTALVAGIVAPANGTIILVLVILGIIVGAININTTEIVPLLIAAVALI